MEAGGNLSVPPGYVSLTSFILKRGEKVKKIDGAATFPTPSEQEPTKADMNDVDAYNQINRHRPWILLDQSNHKPEESHTEHLTKVSCESCTFFCLWLDDQ